MENNKLKKLKYAYSLSYLGLGAGMVYSFYKKTGFWKGVGITVLFSFIGTFTGIGIDYLSNSSKKDEDI